MYLKQLHYLTRVKIFRAVGHNTPWFDPQNPKGRDTHNTATRDDYIIRFYSVLKCRWNVTAFVKKSWTRQLKTPPEAVRSIQSTNIINCINIWTGQNLIQLQRPSDILDDLGQVFDKNKRKKLSSDCSWTEAGLKKLIHSRLYGSQLYPWPGSKLASNDQ